jgi:hypothetical protein
MVPTVCHLRARVGDARQSMVPLNSRLRASVVEVLEMPGREWFPPVCRLQASVVEVLEIPGRGWFHQCISQGQGMVSPGCRWRACVVEELEVQGRKWIPLCNAQGPVLEMMPVRDFY